MDSMCESRGEKPARRAATPAQIMKLIAVANVCHTRVPAQA